MGFDNEDPKLPEKAPHFFTEVLFELIPEINYELLIEFSQIAITSDENEKYLDIRKSLQKIQFAKLAGVEAILLDAELRNRYVEKYIFNSPYIQLSHSRAAFDFISYCKASTDLISNFLNKFFSLSKKGGACDLKWEVFRHQLVMAEPSLGPIFEKYLDWINYGIKDLSNLPSTRDEWIHRGMPKIFQLYPPEPIGALPIPNPFGNECEQDNQAKWWPTEHFIRFHYIRLISLFNDLLDLIVFVKNGKRVEYIGDDSTQTKMSFFPLKFNIDVTLDGVTFYVPPTQNVNLLDGRDALEQININNFDGVEYVRKIKTRNPDTPFFDNKILLNNVNLHLLLDICSGIGTKEGSLRTTEGTQSAEVPQDIVDKISKLTLKEIDALSNLLLHRIQIFPDKSNFCFMQPSHLSNEIYGFER